MQKRKIGPLEVTVVGLGGNNFGSRLDAAATAGVVNAALDAGINFFDTSDNYGDTHSEDYLGRALEGRRSKVVIATKFATKIDDEHPGGAHPSYVRRAVEDSLRRLRTDYIDLYQLHRPDPDVPIAYTMAALDELVRAGKVRAIGCSNFSAPQMREAAQAAAGQSQFVSVQNLYNVLNREVEREVIPECQRLNMAFIPFSPLAGGLLTGKYRLGQPMPEGRLNNTERYARFINERNLTITERLIDFATARGHSLLDLGVSWLLSRPALGSVIAGATRPEQVKSNVDAAQWQLSDAELAEIDAILKQGA